MSLYGSHSVEFCTTARFFRPVILGRMPDSSGSNPLRTEQFRVPFDRIRAGHVEPAVAELLADSRARLEALAAEAGPRTFENTMRALDELTEPLDYAMA